jgi:hypothetical protein
LFDIFFLEIYDVQPEIEPERRRATFQIEEARRQFFSYILKPQEGRSDDEE